MASRVSSKKRLQIWRCDECENFDAMKTPCSHLEKLISEKPGNPTFEGTNRRVNTRRIDEEYYTSGAGFIIPEGMKSGRWEAQFRMKLKKAGLSKLQEDVLTAKFVYEDSFSEIAEQMSLASRITAYRIFRDALEHLKKVGFKK